MAKRTHSYRGIWANGSGRLIIANNDSAAVRRLENIERQTGRKFTVILAYDGDRVVREVERNLPRD